MTGSISFDLYHPLPLLIVISGPSCVGKDAVLKLLETRAYDFHFVVTTTTRPPRPNEVNGVDYFFVSKEEFEEMIQKDELIEWAVVYDQYKGIPKAQVRQALASGKDVIMRLDVQGAARVRSLSPDAVMVFLIPSNEEEWHQRLRERRGDTNESLLLRQETARVELERLGEFDYLVVNAQNKLEETVDVILRIIDAEHHRIHQRVITL